MTIQQLNSLSEDELLILWFCINKIDPPTLQGVDLVPSLFPTINHKRLMNRVAKAQHHIKPEYTEVFNGLISKLKVS